MVDKADEVKKWVLEQTGCPYIYGGTGQFCTLAYRKARAAQYPEYAGKIKKYCRRYNGSAASCKGCRYFDDTAGTGKRAYDCAQLVRSAFRQAGISMVSGSNSQWQKTAWAVQGVIGDMPADRVSVVFRRDEGGRMGHVGMYLGDGTVSHAKGHAYGVVREKLGDSRFTNYGIPEGLYEGMEAERRMQTVRKGGRGEDVRVLQERLNALGFECGATDGICGAKTVSAIKAFQRANGLTADGVCGADTWAAIEGAMSAPKEPTTSQETEDEKACDITREEFEALAARVSRIEEGFSA